MGELDRIRWHCRRGLLELDLVLKRFVDHHYAGLSAEQKRAFEALLEEADNDLLDLAMGRAEVRDPVAQQVVEILRSN
jgi:succinate dehydrogenase flavin-adding protein (antitoxin of CptAB toxin-antitoxin module)